MMQTTSKFDVICKTIDNGIIVLNRDLEIIFWNQWLETRTNIKSDSIISKKITNIFPNIDEKRLKRKISTSLVLDSPTFYTPQTSDYLINIELGKVANKVFNNMQQSITITPLDKEKGLVIVYIYDITLVSEINYHLELTKNDLSEKNKELELILNTTMEAIILFKDDMVIDCNKIALNLFFKSSKNDLIGLTCQEIFHVKDRILEIETLEPIELNIKRKDNSSFLALVNTRQELVNNQAIKILTIVDITELRRKEQIMAEQSKLAAMGEMIGNIAHQWRQPLNIISIATSNLNLKKELKVLDDATLKESLDLILKTTTHLSNTIETFNDYLREDKQKMLFNLSSNINSNIDLIKKYFKDQNINIFLDLDENITLYNYANEFSQAFMNLINNAKDALLFNLNNFDEKFIFISTKELSKSIQIEIYDNAGGIKDEIINKVFEPYFTTKHKYQGTGLGLYMTRNIIVTNMKGSIKVDNFNFTYNEKNYTGAKFTITLPKHKLD